MDEEKSRVSMNTSLANARIFDEDSWEPLASEVKVKQEPEEYDERKSLISSDHNSEKTVKNESKDFIIDEETMFPSNVFDRLDLKKETLEQYLSPVKLEFDENTTSSIDSTSRKSAKRTVFPRESPYKTRQSPYKRYHESQSTSLHSREETHENIKTRKKTKEYESDPEILRRRQKQIDYGKNTIGYDIYTKSVLKSERTDSDPQTPNKYLKYSRRGFDGLIKQWRLKLHKYDPPSE